MNDLEHLLGWLRAVNLEDRHASAVLVVVDDRRGLLVEGFQAHSQFLGRVVAAMRQTVLDLWRRRIEGQVVDLRLRREQRRFGHLFRHRIFTAATNAVQENAV